jgi:hypothetical protein
MVGQQRVTDVAIVMRISTSRSTAPKKKSLSSQ